MTRVRMESQEGTSRDAESNPHPYNVFINHRGPDVKKTFGSHLYAALKGDGLRPFLDKDDIKFGQVSKDSIGEALQGSCVHVAIFSKRHAESEHCLNELCDMLKSGKDILPVFYHVNPADLSMIKNSPFKDGFRKRIKRATGEQISEWKDALGKIRGYRGFRLDEVNGNEEELVRRILAEVRRLMSNVLPGAIGVEPPEAAEALGVGAIGVEPVPSNTEVPEESTVTINPGDRRLNILVLGDPELVEAVIGHICGARWRQTPVEDHVNLTESRNSSPPMCLYGVKKGMVSRNDYTDHIRTFVKVRNEKWRRTKVEALWVNEVHRSGPRNWSTLFSDSTLRLHMVWFACRELSDLPHLLKWPNITEKLCDLPVQILVIEKQSLTQDLDMNDQQGFNKILENGCDFFPNARGFVKELIVKFALQDDDLKGELWRKCWAVKTRVEIGYAAEIIREIRRQLGSAGISVPKGFGARLRKEVSLSRSGEFVLDFLCAYWDIPQNSLRRVLQSLGTTFTLQTRESKISIEPCKFVEFCLIVAAIILYSARDNARKPKYVCSWNVSSESSLEQLQTEARQCYNSYFASSTSQSSLYYDTMVFENIRLFLESIFERKGWDPRPVDRDSFISKIVKRIRPRGKSVSPGMTPSNL